MRAAFVRVGRIPTALKLSYQVSSPSLAVVAFLTLQASWYASGDSAWLGHLERMFDRLCGLSDVLRSPIPGHEFVDALGRMIR